MDRVFIAYHVADDPDANDGQNYNHVEHATYIRARGSFTTHGTLRCAFAAPGSGAAACRCRLPAVRLLRGGRLADAPPDLGVDCRRPGFAGVAMACPDLSLRGAPYGAAGLDTSGHRRSRHSCRPTGCGGDCRASADRFPAPGLRLGNTAVRAPSQLHVNDDFLTARRTAARAN
jgi:hypothetical protein